MPIRPCGPCSPLHPPCNHCETNRLSPRPRDSRSGGLCRDRGGRLLAQDCGVDRQSGAGEIRRSPRAFTGAGPLPGEDQVSLVWRLSRPSPCRPLPDWSRPSETGPAPSCPAPAWPLTLPLLAPTLPAPYSAPALPLLCPDLPLTLSRPCPVPYSARREPQRIGAIRC